MNKEKIVKLARIALDTFVQGNRNDGSKYYYGSPSAPQWVTDMVREAHNDMLPDNYKYDFIVEALREIVDSNGDIEKIQLEASIYTAQLTQWLASNSNRISYVDEAIEEYGFSKGRSLFEMLQAGQEFEKSEVLNSVVNFLDNLGE